MPHLTVSKRTFHVRLSDRFARKAHDKTQSLNRGQYRSGILNPHIVGYSERPLFWFCTTYLYCSRITIDGLS